MNKQLRVSPLDPHASVPLDLFVCASGYETRSRFVAQKFAPRATVSIALGFPKQRVLARDENDRWFKNAGYSLIDTTEEMFASVVSASLHGCLKENTHASVRIGVDISCFSRSRIAAIIEAVQKLEADVPLTVDFYYSIAKFSEAPSISALNTHVGPILPAFAGITTEPDRPTVAVVGLGYEQDKALGALEHLQTEEEWLFEPVSSIHEYSRALHVANQSLLHRIPASRIVQYRVEAPLTLFNSLESLLHGLSNEANPVLLPFGPKIFALCACLVGSINRGVAVWRVSAEHHEMPLEREAAGYVGGLSVTFL